MSSRRYYFHFSSSSSSSCSPSDLPSHTEVLEVPSADQSTTIHQLTKRFIKEYQHKHQVQVQLIEGEGEGEREGEKQKKKRTGVYNGENSPLLLSSIANACLEDREDVFVALTPVKEGEEAAKQQEEARRMRMMGMNNEAMQRALREGGTVHFPENEKKQKEKEEKEKNEAKQSIVHEGKEYELVSLTWSSSTVLKSSCLSLLKRELPSLFGSPLLKMKQIERIRRCSGERGEVPACLVVVEKKKGGEEEVIGHVGIEKIGGEQHERGREGKGEQGEAIAVVYGLVIANDYRHKGLGSKLMNKAKELVKQDRKVKEIIVNCEEGKEEEYWKRQGFQRMEMGETEGIEQGKGQVVMKLKM